MKLFILFYADDTVILSETPSDNQHVLKEFFVYCETWKLHVNVKKTKIVIFSKGTAPKHTFTNDEVIEIVKEFNYLGILFLKIGIIMQGKKRQK